MSSEDRAALLALFRFTGGTRWKRNTNWNTDVHLSEWHGVKVNQDGRVVELSLNANHVRGRIPQALGALTELTNLGLSGNELTGSIPTSLGSISKLQHIYMFFLCLTCPQGARRLAKPSTALSSQQSASRRHPEGAEKLECPLEAYFWKRRITGHLEPRWQQ
ncbi:unnamed protein product [Ectocarpus sp. 12 AP-2014]